MLLEQSLLSFIVYILQKKIKSLHFSVRIFKFLTHINIAKNLLSIRWWSISYQLKAHLQHLLVFVHYFWESNT